MSGTDTSGAVPGSARAAEIERRLADWQARLPAHSIPPGLMAELDALEEALHAARREEAAQDQRHSDECCRNDSERS
jgi:hypothetical protein